MAAMELELITWVAGVLNGDTTVKTSGINPQTGASRTVGIYREPRPDKPLPYIRFNITNGVFLHEPVFGFDFTPSTKQFIVLVSAFAETDPECYNITSRITTLFGHSQITTASYSGFSWIGLEGFQYFTENTSEPDRFIRRGSVRVLCVLE